MQRLAIWFLVGLAAAASSAPAATLYRWTDASGTVRYGHRPPPGVAAQPADEERRNLYQTGSPPACRDLYEQHLKLIDAELARAQSERTGLGAEYSLSPAAKQELILDLLAHRAALLTGRRASDFRAPTFEEIQRTQSQLRDENAKMRQELKSQEVTIEAQRNRLNRARREAALARMPYPILPGYYYYPWGWSYFPPPVKR